MCIRDRYDAETGEYIDVEPRATYYGGDDEAPVLIKNFDEFVRIDCWQEYAYVFVKDRWVGYSVRQHFDENYEEIINVTVKEVQIPKKQTVE